MPLRSRTTDLNQCSADAAPALPDAPGGICGRQRDAKVTADGWSLDYETWQGVRTFDPAVGQWNTPDAYAGELTDPISQKPVMWNRNNPYEYEDPSGYCPKDQGLKGGQCVPLSEVPGSTVQSHSHRKSILDFFFPPSTTITPREFRERAGIPESWQGELTKNGDGWRFKDPYHKGDQIRVMQGNPRSPNAVQQRPYVRWTRSGRFLDKNGNPTNPAQGEFDEASHIPILDFHYIP